LLSDRLRLTLFPEEPAYSAAVDAIDALRYVIDPDVIDPRIPPDQNKVYGPLLEYLGETGHYREYVVGNFPFRRTSSGCDTTQRNADPTLTPNLFVFAYDWRKHNNANAEKLADYVACVQQF